MKYWVAALLVLTVFLGGCGQRAPCKEVRERLGTANPAAVYCEALGYDYEIVETECSLTGASATGGTS